MAGRRIVVVVAAVAVLGALAAAPALAQDRNVEKLSENIAADWALWNPGGAPVSPAFVQAALEQGLTPQQVLEIFESQLLSGAHSTASWSSGERLDYFTQSPELIPQLLEVARISRQAPSWTEYLESTGWAPGEAWTAEQSRGYGAERQKVEAALWAIPGLRDVHLNAVGKVEVPGFGLYEPTNPTYHALVRSGQASMPEGALPDPVASYAARMSAGR